MGKRIRCDRPARLALQTIIADCGRRVQCFVEVALLQDAMHAVRPICPDAGKTVGLQFEPHRELIDLSLAAALLLQLANFCGDSEQVLDVMRHLVCDDIGLRKVAWRTKARLQVIEETEVNVSLPITGTIKRAHRGLAQATR